ncbi:malate dehydrogenase chloroplastic [Prunus yedoensis var. nudiflora]|uniref:Malate dehydrogenase chloroplastic n=1 Tax=Prunus yedoensis var. nudiflora TaxID=2094558 RepID=A0A314ZQS7_PRUYE|nr:malate dehydrogenase chloroplastic [Prunus yedoensis var. nudiflora]
MLPMMTRDDLFNINASIVKKLVDVVVNNCPKLFSVTTLDAATRFIESSLQALDGDEDVYECSYVESNLTELTLFASRVKLGRNEIKALAPYDLQGLTEYEQKGLEALKPKLKASIDNGIAFANKQAVTA